MYIIYILCTIQKNARSLPNKPPGQVPSLPGAGAQPLAWSPRKLLGFFIRLLPRRPLWKLPSLQKDNFYERLFTPIVTLWHLIFQRLAFDHTLEGVVTEAQAGGADSLCRRWSQKLRSTATVSYSNARQRLPGGFLMEALALHARRILDWNPKALWRGLVVSLLDGSTVRMRPDGDIPRKFPPHRKQAKSPADWCWLRVVVCFCAQTGAALDAALGDLCHSEQVLACQIILRLGRRACLFIGDRNFGAFRIVQRARAVGAHVLLRLTETRARQLLGRSLTLGQHPVRWRSTRHDQIQPGCSTDPVEGQWLVVRIKRKGFRTLSLYLFTTLPQTAESPLEELINLYGWRWHIELNLRSLKTPMRWVQLECKSADMAQKEWWAGLMAYNLIRAAMLCAALHKGLGPLTRSFSMSRRHLQNWLAQFGQAGGASVPSWVKMLRLISRALLPRRKKSRPSEPRAQRPLRQPYPPLVGSRQKARQQLKKCQKCTGKSEWHWASSPASSRGVPLHGASNGETPSALAAETAALRRQNETMAEPRKRSR